MLRPPVCGDNLSAPQLLSRTPMMRTPVQRYISNSTECLLQRPGGPRWATDEVDEFGDAYVVGIQVGFRRRSLGSRRRSDFEEDGIYGGIYDNPPNGALRRWSTDEDHKTPKRRFSFRRKSHGSAPILPTRVRTIPSHASNRLRRASDILAHSASISSEHPHVHIDSGTPQPTIPGGSAVPKAGALTDHDSDGSKEDTHDSAMLRVHKWFLEALPWHQRPSTSHTSAQQCP